MKIINIASGKGGTGKTLLTAVLADLLSARRRLKVLIVDTDIFVRGMTSLLYFADPDQLNLLSSEEMSVADILAGKPPERSSGRPGILPYRGFSVWPSVSKINEVISMTDAVLGSVDDNASKRVKTLVSLIPKDFDIVFFDSRAGYDEIIAATHEASDVTISVEEDDKIARITTNNLIAQLNTTRPIYGIVNKARVVRSRDAVEQEVGVIPFDADVMRHYGDEDFWDRTRRTLLEPALVDAWNALCKNERWEYMLTSTRVSPIPSREVETRLARVSMVERILLIYGVMFAIAGGSLAIGGYEVFYDIVRGDPIRAAGVLFGALGFFMMMLAVVRFGSKG